LIMKFISKTRTCQECLKRELGLTRLTLPDDFPCMW
jgi:hypothetical protein